MRSMLLIAVLTVSTLVSAAQPRRVNMPVGHSTTVLMPANVSRVTVADPSMVEVRSKGRQVTLVGRSAGTTSVTVQTADGEMQLEIYVAADKYGLPD